MKKHLLLNQSFGTVGSPNQTDETLTRENRIGLMSYLRRTLMLLFAVLVMSMANIGMAWAYWYLPANIHYDAWGVSDNQMNSATETQKKIVFYNVPAGTYYFSLTNGTEWSGSCIRNTYGSISSSGYQNYGDYRNWIVTSEACDIWFEVVDDENWKVDVSTQPSSYFIKYKWNNGTASWSNPLTGNGDGTYSCVGQYGGTKSFEHTRLSKNHTSGTSGTATISGDNPSTGDMCVFTYKPADNSLTIRKCSDVNKGSGSHTIYFDNAESNWSDSKKYFVIGRPCSGGAAYSKVYTLSSIISNTKLCYVTISDVWDDAAYYGVVGTESSTWTEGSWSWSNLSTATHHSAPYLSNYDLVKSKASLVTKTNADNGGALTFTQYDEGKKMKVTQTINYVLSVDGGSTYAVMSSSAGSTPAKLEQKYYKWNNNTALASQSTNTLNYGNTTYSKAQSDIAYRSKVNVKYESLQTGYEWVGWYDGNTVITTNSSYEYYPNADLTLSARFKAKNYTVTLDDDGGSGGSGTVTAYYKASTNLTSSVSIPTKDGFDFGGYFTEKNGGGTQLINADGSWKASVSGYTDSNKKWQATSNTKVYAKWTATCSTPAAPTAFATSSVWSTSATFTITDAGDAASYDLYYASGSPSDPTSGTTATTNVTTKTPTITGLTASTSYKIWVRSVCDASHKSSWVALGTTSFTTLDPPCFVYTGGTKADSGWPVAASGSITTALYKSDTGASLSGGTVTNSGSGSIGSNNGVKGLVFDGTSEQITVTLTGGNNFGVGTIIVISGASGDDNSSSHSFGFSANGVNLPTVSKSGASQSFETSYTVTSSDGIDGESAIIIKLNTSCNRKTYLKGVTIYECSDDACAATAAAGSDKETSVGVGVAMAATAASSGYTGAWSIKSGSPSTETSQLGTTSSNTMTFTPNTAGTYTLVWTVTDDSDGSCSETDEADVTVSCLTAPVAVSSLTCSAHTTNSLTYTWTKASNASSYTATLYSDADCEVSVEAKALGDVATATFTGLTPNATYYCKVQSKGNGTVYCEDGGTTSEVSGTTDAPSTPTFSPVSGSTVSGSQTITITGHSGSTVYYAWATSEQDADDIYNSGSGSHGEADAGTASTTVQSGKTLYAISRLSGVNSSVSSASYTVDATAPTLSSSVPTNGATGVATSGTIVLTFSEALGSVDGTMFTLTNATKGAVAIDGSDATKVNIAYSGASNSATVTLATAAGAVTDAVGNSSAALSSISFTTEAAAQAAECITWEGTPSSWTGDATPWTMTVSTNLVLNAVGNKWSINSSTNNSNVAGVWQENSADHIETVIAIDAHAVGKYLQGSFADGSVIQSLTIGAANNSGTAGTNNNYVVMFSATEDFATVLADGSGNKAQVVSAPSYKDTYNASNLEKSITVPTGAKFFRIYRKIVGAGDSPWTIGDWTVPSDMGSSAKFRIFKIEACPEGSACTDPTIAWDNTPEDGLVGGSMTASVTSNYPAGVTYSSSVPAVASVNASTGAISYLKAGTTTITATVVGDGTTYCDLADDPSVSQEITVTAVATGIAISPTTIDVQVGGTADLTATLTPAGAADETVTWTSEYTANATVALADEDEDKAAVVTGVALRPSGEAFKIYAKTSRLTANSWYATVRVYKGVTYDATTNGGSCATASAKYYGDAALVLPAATKDGYTFNGWYTTASGEGTKIGETGDEYTPSANSVTLYARFTENVSTYAITYELNSGTHGSTHPTTGTPGTEHELSAPTRSGYTFAGWTVSPVVSGAKWGTTSSPATDITDASTLAVNGTNSVYFKNLAAANGAVTITAHWTQDCETSGGGGSTTTTLSWFDSGTPASSSGTPKKPDTAGKYYYGYTNSAKTSAYAYTITTSDGANVGQGADAEWVNLKYGTSLNVYADNTTTGGTPATFSNVTAISIKIKNKKQVSTFSITIGETAVATNVSLEDANESTFTEYSYSSLSNLSGKITISNTGSGNSEKHFYIDDISITTAGGGDPVVTPCYHVTYHANGAERGTVEDAARYVEGATVTVKPNGFTKAGADFLGWAISKSRADAGTIDYDPDDDENNSFTMGTDDVELWAVWGTAAPRVYSLTGSAYRCTSDAASTITLAGSETGVSYQLYKDGVADGDPVTGTGSALNWSKTAWGTYTVVATRSAVSVDMSGEVVLSDYPLSVTENLDGGTVAQDGEFTLSAKVSVNAANSDDYTYEWFSNDAANYDTPSSLGSATAMAASTGTQQFDYNPSTASGGTTYYFCEFKSPCNTVVRTRVVSVTVTTSTTTLTWDRDGEGDDFEDLPQGGKHTITVSSNSGVAPSLAVAGTDAEITNVEQEGSTTTATLILGASAADVVLTAEVSANGTYAAKSEDKEVIVKECSSDEDVLLSAHLSAYNAFTVDEGSGTATISNPGSDEHVTCNTKSYYKMKNSSTYYTLTLGGKEKFQAGDKIIFDVASCNQGSEKEFIVGLKASTSGSELHSLSTTLTTCDEKEFTIPAGSGLIDGNTVVITRASSENRVYGVSIIRGGGSGSSADVASGIKWIIDPDPGHGQGEMAITRSISNDPFTYAVQATTPSMGTITYESSDEDVATVDANGRVTLRGEGTTTISAKQEAIGCYMESSELSYDLTVGTCTSSEPEPLITYEGTVICPESYQTLTATNYIAGATFQWYKDGVEIGGATSESYNATEAGVYTVVAHKDCYSEATNPVTLTKMSATVDVKTLADEFTIKSERPYNFRLFEIEDGATMTVQSRSGIDAENSVVTLSGNIISISGTAPTIASAGDATVVIRISRTGCTSSYVDKTVTIHKIPATAKPTIAWIATGSDKDGKSIKGDKEAVDADKSNDVDLYLELEKYYTMTARNCYWTTDEAELVKEYSQYDLIILTDYPESKKGPSGDGASKSYTNAIGMLKDHIAMLTFEAFVAQCPNWEIPSNPKNTSDPQNDITLLCNADEIFGTEGKFGAGMAITLSTVASGQALQGFLPADAPFVFLGSITDDATTYIACCERQVNPAARMMIFGLNANTMNNLTSDGKQMVRGFINYLLISDAASIPDCSVIFNGNGADQNWNTIGNWEGETMPNKYASVRIDKPCVVSGGEMAEAGYLKIHTSSVGDTYTGKLTIEDDGVMAIQGTITRIEDNKYTLHLPTRPEDLIIKSTESGQGALIFDNDEGTTQARVEMYTKAYYDGEKDHWQYVASPLISANRWSLGAWTYQFDNVSGEWDYYVDNFSAFKALALAQDNTGTYVFEGALAPTSNQKIAMPATNAIEGTSLIGNSWTAPIQIVNFEESDFGNAKASVYIYETGYDPDGGPTSESGNSGERAAGKWYEIPVFGAATLVTSGGWEGMKVIPAMQAFEVKNKSGAPTTFTMNYERLVRNAVNDKNAARRAPQRAMASVETPTLRITMSDGEIRNDVYLLSGERFSEGFDNGWDGEYVGGNNCSQLYALSPIGNLSMSAQPEMEGTILGFAAGTKTEFTITFHYVGEEELYLNDMEAHRSTLISGENEYTFTAESGERGNRFVIGEQLFGAPEIATGVTDLDAEDLDVQKVIYNDKLYIIRGGKVYSAEGQIVR